MAMLEALFRTDGFAPHGYCLLWDPTLIWLHVVSDVAIALAYLAIPAALAIIGNRRPDLNPFGVLYCFAAFIILCAMTHLVSVVTLWAPVYALSGIVKVACAVVSIITAVLVWKVLRFVLNAPRQSEVAAANAELRRLNEELEARVAERTAELSGANLRLVNALYESREAERTKADFMARMSHELRTPLNAIIGFGEMLRAGLAGGLSVKQHEYSENIHTAAMQLLDQINNILDLERLSHKPDVLAPTRLDLADLCIEVARLQRPIATKADVLLETKVPAGVTVWADRQALSTIVSNLVSNAIKYSPAGAGVSIQARPQPGGVAISVVDRGYGIHPEKLPHILEPFYRAHERELPAVGGTGLGLSLVKMLVEAHGGRLAVESRPNEGTTVTVWLPDEGRAAPSRGEPDATPPGGFSAGPATA